MNNFYVKKFTLKKVAFTKNSATVCMSCSNL